jgi:dihydrofolate reductase
MLPMPRPRHIEGYAIVSEDGMLANAVRIMPESLKFEADRCFFERALDGVDVVVHGRHSHERQPHSYLRRRLILTRKIPSIAADPSNEKALFWNPAGASFEEAMAALGTPDASAGVIGGTDVFGMFLDRYNVFHLTRAPGVRLPGGRPVFPEVPTRTPEEVLTSHGLDRGQRQVLDPAKGLVIVSWQRSSNLRPRPLGATSNSSPPTSATHNMPGLSARLQQILRLVRRAQLDDRRDSVA